MNLLDYFESSVLIKDANLTENVADGFLKLAHNIITVKDWSIMPLVSTFVSINNNDSPTVFVDTEFL